jgi:hypothetical protein
MLKRLLTHVVAGWTGGFVVMYWLLDDISHKVDAPLTFNNLVVAFSWPYHFLLYILGV